LRTAKKTLGTYFFTKKCVGTQKVPKTSKPPKPQKCQKKGLPSHKSGTKCLYRYRNSPHLPPFNQPLIRRPKSALFGSRTRLAYVPPPELQRVATTKKVLQKTFKETFSIKKVRRLYAQYRDINL